MIGKSHIKEIITCCAKCHEGALKGEGIQNKRNAICFRKCGKGVLADEPIKCPPKA